MNQADEASCDFYSDRVREVSGRIRTSQVLRVEEQDGELMKRAKDERFLLVYVLLALFLLLTFGLLLF